MNTIASWEDVPMFDSEASEADFWAENKPDLRLMEAAVAVSNEAAESVTITLRIDPRMLSRIKRLARTRFLNYQSMIKQWLSERMEEECVNGEQKPMDRRDWRRNRAGRAFTLIELIVVMAIIALLAALIVAAAAGAIRKARISRAQSDLAGLEVLLESYKAKFGGYSPDNASNAAMNQLYYELSGMAISNFMGAPYYTGKDYASYPSAQLLVVFDVPGIQNASVDATQVKNFFTGAPRPYVRTDGRYPAVTMFGLPYKGSIQYNGREGQFTPWRYVSSNPTNNGPGNYDLWIDLVIGGKTNRISNWSKDPQIVY